MSEKEFWLAYKVKNRGLQLVDGPHDTRQGAEKANFLHESIFPKDCEGKDWKIAEIILTEPTGDFEEVNEEAVNVCSDLVSTYSKGNKK